MAIERYTLAAQYAAMPKRTRIGAATATQQEYLEAAAVPAAPSGGWDIMEVCRPCERQFGDACQELRIRPRITPGCQLFIQRTQHNTNEKANQQQRNNLRRWRIDSLSERVDYPGCPSCCKCKACYARLQVFRDGRKPAIPAIFDNHDDFDAGDDYIPPTESFLDDYVYKVTSDLHDIRALWAQEDVRCLFPAVAFDGEEAKFAWPTAGEMEILPSYHTVLCRSIVFDGEDKESSFAICSCRSPTGNAGSHCRQTMEKVISYGYNVPGKEFTGDGISCTGLRDDGLPFFELWRFVAVHLATAEYGGCASVLDRTMQDRLSNKMLRSYRGAVDRVKQMPVGTLVQRQAVEAQLANVAVYTKALAADHKIVEALNNKAAMAIAFLRTCINDTVTLVLDACITQKTKNGVGQPEAALHLAAVYNGVRSVRGHAQPQPEVRANQALPTPHGSVASQDDRVQQGVLRRRQVFHAYTGA